MKNQKTKFCIVLKASGEIVAETSAYSDEQARRNFDIRQIHISKQFMDILPIDKCDPAKVLERQNEIVALQRKHHLPDSIAKKPRVSKRQRELF